MHSSCSDPDTLRDLPDIEALEDAGLLDTVQLRAGGFPLPGDDEDDLGPENGEDEEGD
ncbi:hypothetical protein V5F77_23880 [Xanthobacter sp. DSM 24535]|uniref:hypothetical protein n=1 Tax=Roseixanthobacter psychrophilus TaxID=3119917 RepID=UPI00372AB37D